MFLGLANSCLTRSGKGTINVHSHDVPPLEFGSRVWSYVHMTKNNEHTQYMMTAKSIFTVFYKVSVYQRGEWKILNHGIDKKGALQIIKWHSMSVAYDTAYDVTIVSASGAQKEKAHYTNDPLSKSHVTYVIAYRFSSSNYTMDITRYEPQPNRMTVIYKDVLSVRQAETVIKIDMEQRGLTTEEVQVLRLV